MKSNQRISAGKRGGTSFRTPSVWRYQQSVKQTALDAKTGGALAKSKTWPAK